MLTDYREFLREPEDGEEVPYGRFDCPFLEWTEENIGWHDFRDSVQISS